MWVGWDWENPMGILMVGRFGQGLMGLGSCFGAKATSFHVEEKSCIPLG